MKKAKGARHIQARRKGGREEREESERERQRNRKKAEMGTGAQLHQRYAALSRGATRVRSGDARAQIQAVAAIGRPPTRLFLIPLSSLWLLMRSPSM